MSCPQKENGYAAIATEIMEALASIRVGGEATQCLWFILRKTYGFHKKTDCIALSQFCKATLMSKSSVVRALKKLVEMKIVFKTKNQSGISSYSFNKKYSEWVGVTKKYTGLQKSKRKGYNKVNQGVTIKSTTKDTITKDTITKDKSQKKFSDDSIEILLGKKLYEAIQRNNPGHKEPNYQTWGKDFDLMMRVDGRTKEQIMYLILFVHGGSIKVKGVFRKFDRNEFWFSNILSPNKLRKHFDSLAMQMSKKPSIDPNFVAL